MNGTTNDKKAGQTRLYGILAIVILLTREILPLKNYLISSSFQILTSFHLIIILFKPLHLNVSSLSHSSNTLKLPKGNTPQTHWYYFCNQEKTDLRINQQIKIKTKKSRKARQTVWVAKDESKPMQSIDSIRHIPIWLKLFANIFVRVWILKHAKALRSHSHFYFYQNSAQLETFGHRRRIVLKTLLSSNLEHDGR